MKQIKVLIVDDSAFMRREIRSVLERDPVFNVVGACRNGVEALQQIPNLEPDVITLDINMPEMDGLTALGHILIKFPRPVVMVSADTQEGAVTSYEALELGAVDFIGKPGGTGPHSIDEIATDLIYKIKAAATANLSTMTSSRKRKRLKVQTTSESTKVAVSSVTEFAMDGEAIKQLSPKALIIGQSTGGPSTIFEILPMLPPKLGVPVFIVQHMAAGFTSAFAKRLSDNCEFPFKEASDGDLVERGHGYLAPGGFQMTLVSRGKSKGFMIRLSKEPEGADHRPSVDVTMASVLEVYGENTVAVLLTGMGSDGADQMVQVKKAGGRTIAESEETAVVFGMPKEAILRGGAEFIVPSYDIANKIVELIKE